MYKITSPNVLFVFYPFSVRFIRIIPIKNNYFHKLASIRKGESPLPLDPPPPISMLICLPHSGYQTYPPVTGAPAPGPRKLSLLTPTILTAFLIRSRPFFVHPIPVHRLKS